MKVGILIFALLAFVSFTRAQDFPAAEQKWENHHTLMYHKAASGTTSPKIAARLRADYRQVRRTEKRMKAAAKTATRENYRLYGKLESNRHTRNGKRNTYSFHPR